MRPAAALVLGALAALPVHALQISPVRVSVPAGPAHAELWLANPTAQPGLARPGCTAGNRRATRNGWCPPRTWR